MRALIAGIVIGSIASACTQGTRGGSARYSAEAYAAPAPVVRRSAPVWPSAPTPSAVAAAPAPSPYAPRTVAPQPIVVSSRSDVRSAPFDAASDNSGVYQSAPLPAPRSRSASEIAARLRPINATCPVMLGSPVDPSVTTSFNGRVVAFADLSSRTKWLSDPGRYSQNVPGVGGFGSASDGPVFATSSPSSTMSSPSYVMPAAPRVSAPLAAPELPSFAMPAAPPPPAPLPVAARAPYVPAPVIVPAAPPAPAPVAPSASADADAGGTCTDGDCPGGNCKLPPRRK